MKKITLILIIGLISQITIAQCPQTNEFIGDYNLVQVTPIHPENTVQSFSNQVVSLSVGASDDKRVFSALYVEDLGIANQTAMDVSFSMDCNTEDVIVDNALDTGLTCDQNTNITLGPASITGDFDQNDDTSFTLIIAEYVDDGGCGVATPLVTEFTLTKSSCNAPQNIAVNNITNSTADLSWSDSNGAGTTFSVEYGNEGFTLGQGTEIQNITNTSTTLNNLQQGTFYDVYVTANCGSDESVPAGPTDFLIPSDCASVFSGLPLNEDFDSSADFESCYTVIDEDGNGFAWIQEELEIDTGVFANFATNGTNNGQKEDYLISPSINLTAGTDYDISFKYNGADGQNGTANENLEVIFAQGETVADANSGSSIFSDTGISQNGDFANIENQALTANAQFTPNSSGDYYLVFKSTGSPAPSENTTGFLLLP